MKQDKMFKKIEGKDCPHGAGNHNKPSGVICQYIFNKNDLIEPCENHLMFYTKNPSWILVKDSKSFQRLCKHALIKKKYAKNKK